MDNNCFNDNQDSLVSVIMGIYNCENTLAKSIECILAQTYTNIEFIICDDGSTDNSFLVAERYSQEDNRIVLLRNDNNLGLNATLNRCLYAAHGTYIARMDGDDLCSSDRLAKEVDFLNKHPEYAIVSTQMHFFDESGIYKTSHEEGEPKLWRFAMTTQIFHAPCMVRKEAFMAVGGYSEEKDRMRVEDWDLWIRMLEKGYKAYNLGEPLYSMRDDRSAYKRRKYKYRINEAKVSASAVKKLHLPFKYYIYVFRPLLIGLLPKPVYLLLHRH